MHVSTHTHAPRVEGEGNAIITDVIYSSQTTESVSEGDSKEEHKRLVAEMKEEGKALRQLQFREEVLRKEKELLSQFANHVTRVHSVKVCYECACVYVCLSVCVLISTYVCVCVHESMCTYL